MRINRGMVFKNKCALNESALIEVRTKRGIAVDPDLLSRISRTLARETENQSRTLAIVEKYMKSATLCRTLPKPKLEFRSFTKVNSSL